MRLTAELIQHSLSYLNPLKERELDLRGHKIPALENLGVARDQDAIDLTDNDIVSISNIPFSPRLRTLLLARNRVAHMAPALARSTPNLTNLVLTQNNIAELADLEPLRRLGRLTHLSVLDNPVTRKEHYRLWVIYLNPGIRFFDYAKVKDAERTAATELFGTAEAPTELASRIMGIKTKGFDMPSLPTGAEGAGGKGEKPIRVKLTDKERRRVEKMIREAKSLAEISRLERELNEGRVPSGAVGYEDSDEGDGKELRDSEMTG